MTGVSRWIALGLASLLACASPALAQTRGRTGRTGAQTGTPTPAQPTAETTPAPNPTDAEARALFESGRSAYENGQYEDALRDFQRSYELSGRTQLLFNIASVQERLRLDTEALATYRAYLEAQPDTPRRAEVEARIRILETHLQPVPTPAETAAASQAATETETSPPTGHDERRPLVKKWWFWTLVGAVVVGTAVGVGVGVANSGGTAEPTVVGSDTTVIYLRGLP